MLFYVIRDKILADVLGKTYRKKRRKKRFHKLLLYAFDNSKFYFNLYKSHGIKREDLNDVYINDLPVVTKQMIVDNYDDVFTDKKIKIAKVKEWLAKEHQPCSNYLDKYIVVYTSGTTGEPGIFIYDEEEWHYITTYNSLEFLSLSDLLTLANKNLCVTTIVTTYEYFTGINMFRRNKIIKNKHEIPIHLNKEEIYQKLNTINPGGIICYASVISDICEGLDNGKLKISPKYILSTGEYLPYAIHLKIKDLLPKTTIYDSYISTETLTLTVRDDPNKDYYIFAHNAIIELLDQKNKPVAANEDGILTVTNLSNFITPTIRYQFSDYANSNNAPVKDDLGICSLSSFKGRKMQVLPVKDKDGKIQHIHQLQLCIFLEGINKMQFISDKLNELELCYVAKTNLDDTLYSMIKEVLSNYNAEDTVNLTIRKVAKISSEKNGKTSLVKVNFNV